MNNPEFNQNNNNISNIPVPEIVTPVVPNQNVVPEMSAPVTQVQNVVPEMVAPVTPVENAVPVMAAPVAPVENSVPEMSAPVTPVENVVPEMSTPVAQVENVVPEMSAPVAPIGNVVPEMSAPVTPVGNVVPEMAAPVAPVENIVPEMSTPIAPVENVVPEMAAPVAPVGNLVPEMAAPIAPVENSVPEMSTPVAQVENIVLEMAAPIAPVENVVPEMAAPVAPVGNLVPEMAAPIAPVENSVPEMSTPVAQVENIVLEMTTPVAPVENIVPDIAAPVAPIENVVPEMAAPVENVVPEMSSPVAPVENVVPEMAAPVGNLVPEMTTLVTPVENAVPEMSTPVAPVENVVPEMAAPVAPVENVVPEMSAPVAPVENAVPEMAAPIAPVENVVPEMSTPVENAVPILDSTPQVNIDNSQFVNPPLPDALSDAIPVMPGINFNKADEAQTSNGIPQNPMEGFVKPKKVIPDESDVYKTPKDDSISFVIPPKGGYVTKKEEPVSVENAVPDVVAPIISETIGSVVPKEEVKEQKVDVGTLLESPVTSSEDTELLEAYIGKNYHKITTRTFNFAMLFFNSFYLFYRKMYFWGILLFIVDIVVCTLLPDIGIFVYLIISALLAFMFNNMYISRCYNKISKLKAMYNNKSNQELKSICAYKGGTSVGKVFLGFFNILFLLILLAFVLIFLFTPSYLKDNETLNQIKTSIDSILKGENIVISTDSDMLIFDYDTEINIKDEFEINVPLEFKDNSDTYRYNYSYSNNLGECSFTFGALTNKNNVTSLASEISLFYSPDSTSAQIITYNNIKWTYLSVTDSFETTYYYITEKDKKVYLLKFEIDAEDENSFINVKDEILEGIK